MPIWVFQLRVMSSHVWNSLISKFLQITPHHLFRLFYLDIHLVQGNAILIPPSLELTDDGCDIISNVIEPHICFLYVLHLEKEVTDQTRQQIFKTTYRRKIDLRRMTAVCKGHRELARSLVVNSLREIADDIENGK